MGVSVNQKIRTGVAGCSLHRFDIAARDHQLVGGAGMSQPVEDDAGELRVSVLPFEELFADQNGLHGLTIGQAEKHSAVVVAVWGAGLVFFQPFQPVFQFLPESGGQKDIPAGGLGFGAFQYERSFAAFQFIGKLLDDTVAIHLKQGVF